MANNDLETTKVLLAFNWSHCGNCYRLYIVTVTVYCNSIIVIVKINALYSLDVPLCLTRMGLTQDSACSKHLSHHKCRG